MINNGDEIQVEDIREGDLIRVDLPDIEEGILSMTFYASQDADQRIYPNDGVKYTMVKRGEWVPLDVTFISWVDSDHEINVAFRYGHPENHVWSYNGFAYSEEQFRPIVERGITHKNIHYLEIVRE